MKSEKSTPRNIKISFLQKLIAYTSLLIQRRVDVFSDPEQIVAGLECSKTNRMLQCVVEGITQVLDKDEKKSDEYWLNFETFAELLNRINGSKEYSTMSYCRCFGEKKHNEKWEGLPVDKNGAKTDEWPKKKIKKTRN